MKGVNMFALVTGIIMIVVALLMFGIVLDAVHTLLSNAHIGDYTGLQQMVSISPLLIFLALLAGGGWLTFKGFSGSGGGRKGKGGGGGGEYH